MYLHLYPLPRFEATTWFAKGSTVLSPDKKKQIAKTLYEYYPGLVTLRHVLRHAPMTTLVNHQLDLQVSFGGYPEPLQLLTKSLTITNSLAFHTEILQVHLIHLDGTHVRGFKSLINLPLSGSYGAETDFLVDSALAMNKLWIEENNLFASGSHFGGWAQLDKPTRNLLYSTFALYPNSLLSYLRMDTYPIIADLHIALTVSALHDASATNAIVISNRNTIAEQVLYPKAISSVV